jgi:hypothetical protein
MRSACAYPTNRSTSGDTREYVRNASCVARVMAT